MAAVPLIGDPVFGSFAVGIPLLLVVPVHERGLDGIPVVLYGASSGPSLVFGMFLGRYRGVFGDGLPVAGLIVSWCGFPPVRSWCAR